MDEVFCLINERRSIDCKGGARWEHRWMLTGVIWGIFEENLARVCGVNCPCGFDGSLLRFG